MFFFHWIDSNLGLTVPTLPVHFNFIHANLDIFHQAFFVQELTLIMRDTSEISFISKSIVACQL